MGNCIPTRKLTKEKCKDHLFSTSSSSPPVLPQKQIKLLFVNGEDQKFLALKSINGCPQKGQVHYLLRLFKQSSSSPPLVSEKVARKDGNFQRKSVKIVVTRKQLGELLLLLGSSGSNDFPPFVKKLEVQDRGRQRKWRPTLASLPEWLSC